MAVVAVLCPLGIASDTAGGGYRLAKDALGKEYQGRLSGGVKSGSATREGRQAIVSVVTTVAALAAIGLLFAMDPGGAIAQSGFPDYREMDWKQLAVWGFRTIGVVVAQLLIIVLWLWPKYRPPAGARGASTPVACGGPAARFNARGGGICAGRPHDMEPDAAGLHHRDVPARHAANRGRRNKGSASYTGCLGRAPHSMTGNERYATACRRAPQRLMRCMKG